MNFRIVKIPQFSGEQASLYTVLIEEEHKTLFDRFIEENKISFKSELKSIVERLIAIGHETGVREQFLKLDEGKPGDGVCALYDQPGKKLRLYGIRYGSLILILGGGGPKPKGIRALQDDEHLKRENYFLRDLSTRIRKRMNEKEIYFSRDYTELEGNLTFNDQDDE